MLISSLRAELGPSYEGQAEGMLDDLLVGLERIERDSNYECDGSNCPPRVHDHKP